MARAIGSEPNYAFERTVMRRRNHRRHHAAAQRERYGARPVVACLFLLASTTCSVASATEVSVRHIRDNQYEVELTNSTALSETEAQAIVASSAATVCKELVAVPGKYKFESKQLVGASALSRDQETYRFTQQVSCEPIARAETTVRLPMLHTPEESRIVQKEIVSKSEAYFQLIATRHFEEAYAQVSSLLGVDKVTWTSDQQSFSVIAGEPIQISIVKVTVYDNPAEAPAPGLYVAADFSNVYKNVPIHCGYLMWYRPIGGAFQITRKETGYVTTEQLKKIPADQLPEIKEKLRCVAP